MRVEATPQQIDPVGGITARPIVIATTIVALVIAVAMSIGASDQVNNPLAAVAALVSLATAGAVFIVVSNPYRAPVTMLAHAVVCLLALLAILLNQASQWGSNDSIRDDWGPLSMAVLSISFCSYRPARELVICGAVSTVVISAIVLLHPPVVAGFDTSLLVLMALTPVLASAAAAAGFSSTLVRILRAWQREGRSDEARATVSQSVSGAAPALVEALSAPQSRLLTSDVLPFLRSLNDDGDITPGRATAARALSNDLRTLMVAEADESWLTRIVPTADDAQRRADLLAAPQRSLLRALLERLNSDATFTADSLLVAVEADGDGILVVIKARVAHGASARTLVAPYLAVGRSVFPTSTDAVGGAAVRLTFSTRS